jgi:hypothetical protein
MLIKVGMSSCDASIRAEEGNYRECFYVLKKINIIATVHTLGLIFASSPLGILNRSCGGELRVDSQFGTTSALNSKGWVDEIILEEQVQ